MSSAAEKALAVLIPDIIKRRQNEEGPDKKPAVQPDNEFAVSVSKRALFVFVL